MYADGQGVLQNATEAAKWVRKAADQGDAAAQYALSLMYAKGQGVPEDYASAHKWSNLAAAAGHEQARSHLEKLGAFMQKEQIAEAQRLAREWHEAHSNPSEGIP
jgi:TPR repeat protein